MGIRFSDRVLNSKKSFIREILKATQKADMISFAGGLPNPISFPVDEIKDASHMVLDEDGQAVLQYSSTEGYLPLREYISKRYKQRMGIDVSPSEILITNGSQQGLDLIGKVFLNKGDKVAIERPGYLGAIQALSMFEPEMLDVDMDDNGVITHELTKVISEHCPKIFYSVPNFQNPSGITYSDETRENVGMIINNSDTILIEDDPYGELRFIGEDKQSMKKYIDSNIIMLGSFSKIVSPGMRLGWICANEQIMDKIIVAKQAADLHSNYFTQRVLYQYLADNDIKNHIDKIKMLYKSQRDCMVSMIEKHFPSCVKTTKPEGGMFVWVSLPSGLSAMDLFEKAYEKNVAFVPGLPFYANCECENTFRLNYSNSDNESIEKGIVILGELIKDSL